MISKLGLGFIVDRGWLKLRPAILLMTVFCSLSLLITPWLNSFWSLMASTVVSYSTSATLYSLNDLYTRELLGADLLACAFGWMKLVAAVFMFSLGFFPGKDSFVQIKNLQCNVREKNQMETTRKQNKHVAANTGCLSLFDQRVNIYKVFLGFVLLVNPSLLPC